MKKSKLIALVSLIFTLVGSLIISACTNAENPPKVEDIVDETAPVITVEGEREYLVHLGKTFYLPKITATDDVDDELTSKIVVKHGEEEVAVENYSFVAEKSGEYIAYVSVSDKSGNRATEEITVHVTGETELNSFDTATRMQDVKGKGIVEVSHNTNLDYVRYGTGSAKIEVQKHVSLSWPGIVVNNLPITDILDYYSVSFWVYNDGIEDINIFLQRNEIYSGAKFFVPAKTWTKIEVTARNYDNVFLPMEGRTGEPEVGACEDIKCITFHFVNPANTPTFNIYVDEIQVNKEKVFDTLEISADITHPVINTEYTMPKATVKFGGEEVDATVTYELFDEKFNKLEIADDNTYTFANPGKYTLVVNAEHNGLKASANYMLVCAKVRAANEIEFFEDESALNFFKSEHFAISLNREVYHTDNGSTASMKIHACPSPWPYLTMNDLPYGDLEDVAYIYMYAKTDYSLKEGQKAYLGIRDGGRGKVLKRLTLSNDWQCFALTKSELENLGVTTLHGLQLCVELYDLSNPVNQGGWCPVAFNTYIDNFTVASIQDPIAKEDGVVLDFANYRDMDDLHSNYISYNFADLSKTLNNLGSLKVSVDGKWPEVTLGESFAKYTLDGVKNVVFEVLVPSIPEDGFLRLGINDKQYQKVLPYQAGEWVTLYVPVVAVGADNLGNIKFNMAKSNGNEWVNVGTVYIGKVWLDYNGKPEVDLSAIEFTGAESENDLYMFSVTNSDYTITLNAKPEYVKEGSYSIKLSAIPRWPQYFFTETFTNWLTKNSYVSISFDLYIDAESSETEVTLMEGIGAGKPVLNEWFTVTAKVSELVGARLQFNKPLAKGLNVYLDNVKFIEANADHVKEDGVVFDFYSASDVELLTTTVDMSYNTDADYTLNGKGSLKLNVNGKWPEIHLDASLTSYSTENVKNVVFEVYVVEIPDGGYLRLGINNSQYQKVMAADAGKWVTLRVPAAAVNAENLANMVFNISKSDGATWVNVGVVYIGKIWLEYN